MPTGGYLVCRKGVCVFILLLFDNIDMLPSIVGGEIKNGKEAAGDEFSSLIGIFTYLTFMGEFNCFWFMHHIRGIKKAF